MSTPSTPPPRPTEKPRDTGACFTTSDEVSKARDRFLMAVTILIGIPGIILYISFILNKVFREDPKAVAADRITWSDVIAEASKETPVYQPARIHSGPAKDAIVTGGGHILDTIYFYLADKPIDANVEIQIVADSISGSTHCLATYETSMLGLDWQPGSPWIRAKAGGSEMIINGSGRTVYSFSDWLWNRKARIKVIGYGGNQVTKLQFNYVHD